MLKEVDDIATASKGSIFMVDSNSDWIYNNKDKSKEWSFMYDDRKNENFKNEYPDAWQIIKSNDQGYFVNEDGMFSYNNIVLTDKSYFNTENVSVKEAEDWYIISHISLDMENGEFFSNNIFDLIINILTRNYIYYFLLFGISIILAVLITINKMESDKIKYFSEYDTMTGTYNRRAGFEKLEQLYKNINKDDCNISVCFIDINGLKDVNDFLGHEVGDELILSVINGIRMNIREDDFVSRLGGDEFLIIFKDLEIEKAELVWQI